MEIVLSVDTGIERLTFVEEIRAPAEQMLAIG